MLTEQSQDVKAKFVDARAAKSTMGKQSTGPEPRRTTAKTQFDEAQLALEKLTGESSKTDAYLWTHVVILRRCSTWRDSASSVLNMILMR